MNGEMPLSKLRPGQKGVVTRLLSRGSIRRRFLDIGLIENTQVECLGRGPGGDPSAFMIRGAVIAIRAEDGESVMLKPS